MQEKSDIQLLREYAAQRNEAAFREIVDRHTDLVYSSALRQVLSPDLAGDVAQSVFTDLARKARPLARSLEESASLLGWLFRSTRFAALNQLREDRRRQARERQAMEHFDSSPETTPEWDRVGPVLDEAMGELNDEDREAVLLRFFKNRDFRAIGQALGVSDDAAQKRVSRALDRLHSHLVSRGVTTTAIALSTTLSANAVQAAPVGLAVTLSTGALAGAGVATAATASATEAIAMTTLQKTIIGATLAVAVGTGVYEASQNARLRDQIQMLQQQQAPLTEQVRQLIREKGDLSRRLAVSEAEAMKLGPDDLSVKGKPSLAEIEAKIREFSSAGYNYRNRDRRRQRAEWEEFAGLIDSADITQTLAILDRVGSTEVSAFFRGRLMTKWAESDPKAAADFASKLPAGRARSFLISRLAEEWASSDLDSAIAWATRLPDARNRETALWKITPQWAETDPEGVLTFVQSLPAGHTRSRILERMAFVLGLLDPAKAIEFANRLPHGSNQDSFIANIAYGMAFDSPRDAAIFVSNLPAGEAQKFAALDVARVWLSTDPQSAAAWVSAFPAGETREKVVRNLVPQWASADPKAAGEWLATLPAEQCQETIRRYIREVVSSHRPYSCLELAVPFVEKIINPKERNSTIEDIAREWLTIDPPAARAWLAKTSLPDGRKQRLLKNLNKN